MPEKQEILKKITAGGILDIITRVLLCDYGINIMILYVASDIKDFAIRDLEIAEHVKKEKSNISFL